MPEVSKRRHIPRDIVRTGERYRIEGSLEMNTWPGIPVGYLICFGEGVDFDQNRKWHTLRVSRNHSG